VAATGGLLLFGALLLAPAALFFGDVSADALPFVAASAALEVAYFALLARAYAGGELGVVYPTARGLAPVLVLGAGVLGLGEGVSVLGVVGVLLIVAGVLIAANSDGLGVHTTPYVTLSRRDVLFGVAIGATIAGYTLVDSEGLDHADPIPYLFLIAAVSATAYNGALIASGKRPELSGRAALTAAATVVSYAMVLAALQLAPPAAVAAVRESSIVIAALLAWLFLGEPRRLGPAVLVAAGVGLIAYA
jgi:drug/metabolite transporter (DMT)-like permease